MDPIFTIPYTEYQAIVQIRDCLRGQSVFIPVTRQQKDIDLLIHDLRSHRTLTVQVKGSRPYINKEAAVGKDDDYVCCFWFRRFRYRPRQADVCLFVGLYPSFRLAASVRKRSPFWGSIVLAFTDAEMGRFLRSLDDDFFYIAFTDPKKVFCTRGFPREKNVSKYLLEKRMGLFLRKLR